jgi:hypothetical protein
MNTRDKKISVLNVRVDSRVQSEKDGGKQRVRVCCELHYGSFWTIALPDTGQGMPGRLETAEQHKTVHDVPSHTIPNQTIPNHTKPYQTKPN